MTQIQFMLKRNHEQVKRQTSSSLNVYFLFAWKQMITWNRQLMDMIIQSMCILYAAYKMQRT